MTTYQIGIIPRHACDFSPVGESAAVGPEFVQVWGSQSDVHTRGRIVWVCAKKKKK